MKIVAIKGNLKEGLAAVERSCGENLNLPILKNVLLEAANGQVKVTGTNLEIATTYTISGKVLEEGKITAPANLLSGLIGSLSNERLNLEVKNTTLEVKTDNYESSIQGLAADDYPIIPKIKNTETWLEVAGDMLKEALEQTLVSAQTSELRPELNSLLFLYTIEEFKVVGTDAARLSEKTINKSHFSSNFEAPFRVLVPQKTCQEVARILKDEDKVRIYLDPNQILFKTERFECISRLIDGNFPDYGAIVPQKFENETIINKDEFMNALKVSGIFSSRVNEIKLKISDNKKVMEVFSGDQGIGQNNCVLPVKSEGANKEVSFNWRYLADGLRAINGKEVFIGFGEENRPALLRAPSDTSYFYILMPILRT